MITVQEITTPAQTKEFIHFPWLVYKNDPQWVPPLIKERLDFFNPKKNPYFRHSAVKLFMAYRDGQPVGRLSVQENNQYHERHGGHTGFFGFFECVDDMAVARPLFDRGASWLVQRGCDRIQGPYNFSINGEYALLVDGFNQPPMVLMTHNPPYYARLLERYGFSTAQNMFAYHGDINGGLPQRIIEQAAAVQLKYPKLSIRKMNLARLDREVRFIYKIYTEAWDENWGATPMTEPELMALANELKLIVDEDLAFFLELDGQPIGFSLTLPDINQAIKRANGRLFPFGLLKLLWEKRRIKRCRVLAMGILKEHRHHDFDKVFYVKTYEAAKRKGMTEVEMSLINETNLPMRRVLDSMGASVYKTYRIYEKMI